MRLHELAVKVNMDLELSDSELRNIQNSFLTDGKFLKDIENFNFKIFDFKSKRFGLFSKDDKLIGFIEYSMIDNEILNLDKIFIKKEFRNLKIGTVLLFWFKNIYQKPVFIGGAVFNDGEKFIRAIANHGAFDLFSYNLRTKEKSEFNIDSFFDFKQFTGMLIESWEQTSWWDHGSYEIETSEDTVPRVICLEIFKNEPETPIDF
jgi:hypothetical protein